MTPEAVVFRYLEILRSGDDRRLLARMLSTDADLLGRWLRTLECPADPVRLIEALDGMGRDQLQTLAQAQAWQLLPTLDTARLAMDQWQSVCCSAHLAESVAAHLLAEGWAAATIQAPERVRMQILLAISGVTLEYDAALVELAEFRGIPEPLLLDADPLPQIFALVERWDTEGNAGAAAAAHAYFGIDEETFERLVRRAEAACAQELLALDIHEDVNVDWHERLWTQQQIDLLTSLFPPASSADEGALLAAHEQAARSLFRHEPRLFLPSANGTHWESAFTRDVRVRQGSTLSEIARVGRDGATRRLEERFDGAVADRQVLRRLGVEEALVVPVLHPNTYDVLAVLVFAGDDELEPHYAMRGYADALARWLSESGEGDHSDAGDDLQRFREQTEQRLRELVHEANNPLSIVRNYLHILEMRIQDETAQEQLALIGQEIQRAAGILQQMRSIPDPQASPEPPDVRATSFDLNQVVRSTVELHEGLAGERSVQLGRQLCAGALSITSDQDLITQILTNLLKNAIEACTSGDEVIVTTYASVVRDGERGAAFEVMDTGPGLPEDVLDALWEPKVSRKGGAHEGLGLSLVGRLVAALGGRVDVRTAAETGTEFSIFLPSPANLAVSVPPGPPNS